MSCTVRQQLNNSVQESIVPFPIPTQPRSGNFHQSLSLSSAVLLGSRGGAAVGYEADKGRATHVNPTIHATFISDTPEKVLKQARIEVLVGKAEVRKCGNAKLESMGVGKSWELGLLFPEDYWSEEME